MHVSTHPLPNHKSTGMWLLRYIIFQHSHRSASVLCTGEQSLYTELRVRTLCELVLNKGYYLQPEVVSILTFGEVSIKNVLPSTSRSFEDARKEIETTKQNIALTCLEHDCKEMATGGTWSNMWHVHALASVLKHPIQSIYPDEQLRERKAFNRLVMPREGGGGSVTDRPFHIMWTRQTMPQGRQGWSPNHFVPCVSATSTQPATTYAEAVSKEWGPFSWKQFPQSLQFPRKQSKPFHDKFTPQGQPSKTQFNPSKSHSSSSHTQFSSSKIQPNPSKTQSNPSNGTVTHQNQCNLTPRSNRKQTLQEQPNPSQTQSSPSKINPSHGTGSTQNKRNHTPHGLPNPSKKKRIQSNSSGGKHTYFFPTSYRSQQSFSSDLSEGHRRKGTKRGLKHTPRILESFFQRVEQNSEPPETPTSCVPHSTASLICGSQMQSTTSTHATVTNLSFSPIADLSVLRKEDHTTTVSQSQNHAYAMQKTTRT